MPSFYDSVFLFFLALILFGPKRLPELARQLGKLMGEFRRASNEFKYQMEEELRITERAENEKKAAAAVAAATEAGEPAPIASEGELTIKPPSTGLPTPAGGVAEEAEAIAPLVNSIPTEFPDDHHHTYDHILDQPPAVEPKPAEVPSARQETHG